MATVRKKIVIVGNGVSGKTSLLTASEAILEAPESNSVKNPIKTVTVDGEKVQLELWDTQGQEDYDKFRQLTYHAADVLLICFSIKSPESLEEIEERFMPEVRSFCPNVPIVLVGNMKDSRDDPSELRVMKKELVKFEVGKAMAKKINAVAYLECSAKKVQGVQEVFDTAARAALHPKKKSECLLS